MGYWIWAGGVGGDLRGLPFYEETLPHPEAPLAERSKRARVDARRHPPDAAEPLRRVRPGGPCLRFLRRWLGGGVGFP